MNHSTDASTGKSYKSSFMLKLVLFPCLMFGFGFLLIPLYDVFCDITGLNGKFDLVSQQTANQQQSSQQQPSQVARLESTSSGLQIEPHNVILQFTAASDQQDVWKFLPASSQLNVQTGKQYKTHFTLQNPTDQEMVFTSIPSISPGLAADYLIKTECFCFEKQVLQAGEQVEMPLIFQLRNDIPKEYSKLTLAYRIYAQAKI